MPVATEQQDTNAALATLAAAGNSYALGQLWELNKGLLRSLFWKWYPAHKALADAHGLTADDFEQEGFFAVQHAAQTYNPTAGTFANWLVLAQQRQIQLALSNGHRRLFVDEDGKSHTTSADPLNHCTSLDVSIDPENADSSTLGELQPDPAAEQAFTDAETRLYSAGLRVMINTALDACSPSESATMRHRFFDGLSCEATSEKMGIPVLQVKSAERRAFQKLRSNPKLRQWHAEQLKCRAWHGTGLASWKSGCSVEERITEQLEELEYLKFAQKTGICGQKAPFQKVGEP